MSLLGRLVRGSAKIATSRREVAFRKEYRRQETKAETERAKREFLEKKRSYSYGIYKG